MSDKFIEYSIPSPNKEMAEWLKGPECRVAITNITAQIFTYYQNTLPEITGELKRGAYFDVQMDGWGANKDRWFGIVGNRAVSYRPETGKPYPRYIEGGTRKMPGQHQLARAVAQVTGEVTSGALAIPGVRADPSGRGSKLRGAGGKFIRNPLKDTK